MLPLKVIGFPCPEREIFYSPFLLAYQSIQSKHQPADSLEAVQSRIKCRLDSAVGIAEVPCRRIRPSSYSSFGFGCKIQALTLSLVSLGSDRARTLRCSTIKRLKRRVCQHSLIITCPGDWDHCFSTPDNPVPVHAHPAVSSSGATSTGAGDLHSIHAPHLQPRQNEASSLGFHSGGLFLHYQRTTAYLWWRVRT